MSPEMLGRVLDEGMGLQRIELHNGGETLLHPDLPAMFEVIRDEGAGSP